LKCVRCCWIQPGESYFFNRKVLSFG
jgi:hypothetical protein